MHLNQSHIEKRIKQIIVIFVVCLVLSGATAIPIYTELKWLMQQHFFTEGSWMQTWLTKVWVAVNYINNYYPLLLYGYDWLAFAHFVIAFAFIGPYKNPVKNEWIIDWAMICCISIFPLAFIMGTVRGIPIFHILIDCSFGLVGLIPLWYVKKLISQLKKMTQTI